MAHPAVDVSTAAIRAAGAATWEDHCTRTLPAAQILDALLAAAGRPLAVRQVASALGLHRRTLVNRLDRAGLPGPQALAAWCRLLAAARLLDDPTSTIEEVAHDLDFPSGNALRNQLRRHAGVPPSTLRERGGYAYLRGRFVALLAGGQPVEVGADRS